MIAIPAAPIIIAHTFAYWLNSMYQLKPPMEGISRSTTFATSTKNMTARRTDEIAVRMRSNPF